MSASQSVSQPRLVVQGGFRSDRFVVREQVRRPGAYEPEHSERQVNGSVEVEMDARWSGTLAVPMTGDQSLLITIERHGPTPPGAPLVDDVAIVIPPGEADAVITLLRGLVDQAKEVGVIRKPA